MEHRLFVRISPVLYNIFRCVGLSGLFFLFFWAPVSAQTKESSCQKLYKEQSFSKAGDCYKLLLKNLRTQKRNDFRDLIEDRYLRNAAICYAKAANQPAHQTKQAILRNRAAGLLLESFRSGSCKASGRCESNRKFADQLLRQIKAAPLVVLTGNEEARITISGPEFSRQALGQFSESVLPGEYTIEVVFPPKNKKTQTVTIQPDIGRTINVSPDKIRVLEKRIVIANKTPPLVIAGYVAGGVILAAGIPMLVYGPLEQGRLNGLLSDPKTARTITDEEYNNSFSTASTILTVGIIAAAVGVVVIGAAAIGHAFSQSSKKETTRELPGLSLLPPQTSPTTFGKSRSSHAQLLLPTISMP